jgi:hypothetical protein
VICGEKPALGLDPSVAQGMSRGHAGEKRSDNGRVSQAGAVKEGCVTKGSKRWNKGLWLTDRAGEFARLPFSRTTPIWYLHAQRESDTGENFFKFAE